jgi:integrase
MPCHRSSFFAGPSAPGAARLCHLAGGELDQIQFLLGHVSIQTTEQYLGCKQKLRYAVNDKMGIEP